jgi:hypothetical protein
MLKTSAPLLLAGLLIACPPTGDDDDSAAVTEPPPAAWITSAPSPGTSVGEDLAAMPDGGVVVTGAFADVITFDSGGPNETALTSGGAFDIFVARYGADGALHWAVRCGGADGAWGMAIAADDDGNSWVVGRFAGTATFGGGQTNETTIVSEGSSDLFVARFDPDGELLHVHAAQGENDDVGTGVAVAPDGGAFVTGYGWALTTFGPGEPEETILLSLGAQDVYVARYAVDGTLVWVRSIPGGSSQIPYDLAATADGGFLITGEFTSGMTAGQGEANETSLASNAGNLDGFIARYNGDGSLMWARNEVIGFPDRAQAVAADGDDAVVVGYFRGPGTFGAGQPNETAVQSGGFDDGWMGRYDSTGTLLSFGQGGGAASQGSTSPRDVAVTDDGRAVMVGQFTSTTTFGGVTLPQQGQGDIFVTTWGADGSLQFALSGGSTEAETAEGVVISDGSAFITGWFGGALTFDTGNTVLSAAPASQADFFLMKIPVP